MENIHVFTKEYLFGSQIVEEKDIPEYTNYQCLYKDGEQIAYIENYISGRLSTLQNSAPENEAAFAAEQTALNALANGAFLDFTSDVQIDIYTEVDDLDLGFELTDNQIVVVKVIFAVSYNCEGIITVRQIPTSAYEVELYEDKPPVTRTKRIVYNSSKQLMYQDYILYTFNEELNVLNPCSGFTERSTEGKKEYVSTLETDDKVSVLEGNSYILPAFRDQTFESAKALFEPEMLVVTDTEMNPLTEEDLEHHRELFQIDLDGEQQMKSRDCTYDRQLTYSVVYGVPLSEVWPTFHAYMRSLHEKGIPISTDPLKATHYLHILGEPHYDSIGAIELEEGESRIHTVTIHLNGNLISHECEIYSTDDVLVRKYLMSGLSCLAICHSYDIAEPETV
jgi:hypothetical protein